ELLDFRWRHRRRLGDDDDLVRREVWKRLDRNRVERIAACRQERDEPREHEPSIPQRAVDDSRQHRYSPSMLARNRCDFSTKLPLMTTCSPGFSPSRTGAWPAEVCPSRTGRTVNRSAADFTKTMS